MEFDETGDFLATGDRGGRIVIFNARSEKDLRTKNYAFYTEFQSHDPEFDYLKSLEIEEKINKIRWCKTPNHAKFLISTNGENDITPSNIFFVVVQCSSPSYSTTTLSSLPHRAVMIYYFS